jgi:GNAT superfamily N-acetyltransferase
MVGNRDFEDALRQCISNAAAFCRVDEQERVEGIIAIDRDGNSIEWLAVDEKARGKNVGHELVRTALENLDSTRDVVVQTFSGEVKEGAAARRLYESFGFVDDKPGGENPAGLGLRDGAWG